MCSTVKSTDQACHEAVLTVMKLRSASQFGGTYLLTASTSSCDIAHAGAESIAVAPDGSLYLFDRSGTVLHATELGPTAEPQLHAAAVAHIGGGRTLGAHFDREGNLIFCHPPVVSPPLVDRTQYAPSWRISGHPVPEGSLGSWLVCYQPSGRPYVKSESI